VGAAVDRYGTRRERMCFIRSEGLVNDLLMMSVSVHKFFAVKDRVCTVVDLRRGSLSVSRK
jgi:hypothetical protein